MIFGMCSLSSCIVVDNLDMALEVEELTSELNSLKEENQSLKEEVINLKFELAFPNGLITESCILNNVTIVRTDVNAEGSVYAIRSDGPEVEVTINNGYYDAGSGSLYNIAVWAHNNSKIIINDGEFVTGNDINGDANHCIYAAGGSIIEINGGIFRSNGSSEWLLNCQDGNGTIVVTGGTFINFNPADCISEGEHTSFIAEGYEVKSEQKEDGSIWYTVIKSVEEIEPEIPEVEEPETPKEF